MNSEDKEKLQHEKRTNSKGKKEEEMNSIKRINECDILMKENKSVAEKKEECLTVGCML